MKENILNIVLGAGVLIVTFLTYYFYIKGKVYQAVEGAVSNAEQEDRGGTEKLEFAIDQIRALIPLPFRAVITRKVIRCIVQTAFDQIEEYAQKQVIKHMK